MEALKNGDADVAEMRTAYNQRRRFLMNAFREMGLDCFEPYGAFYVFPCIKEFGMTPMSWARYMSIAGDNAKGGAESDDPLEDLLGG